MRPVQSHCRIEVRYCASGVKRVMVDSWTDIIILLSSGNAATSTACLARFSALFSTSGLEVDAMKSSEYDVQSSHAGLRMA